MIILALYYKKLCDLILLISFVTFTSNMHHMT